MAGSSKTELLVGEARILGARRPSKSPALKARKLEHDEVLEKNSKLDLRPTLASKNIKMLQRWRRARRKG